MAAAQPPDLPLVSVIIPTKDAGPQFARTLESIAGQSGGYSRETIVIDSGSTDDTLALSRQHGARVICVPPGAFQHGATRNEAIRQARGRYVALLVQDAIPADDRWLGALVEALESGPRVAGAYSRHVGRPETDYLSRHLAELWHERVGRRWVQEIDDLESFRNLPWEEQRARCTFDDVSSLIRRSVWQEWPLPEVAYGEDVAWAKQVLEAGYQIVYEPASVVLHSHERSPSYELRRSFVDSRTMGELFPQPIELLTIAEAQALLGTFERECTLARASGDAELCQAALAEAVESYLEGMEWYRSHFDSEAVRRVFGPGSAWTVDHRQHLLHKLDLQQRASHCPQWLAGARILWRLAALWSRLTVGPPLSARLGQAVAGGSLSAQELAFTFACLWQGPERDAVRQAVWGVLEERQLSPVDKAELGMRSFSRQILPRAAAAGVLTPALYWRVRQIAAAWVIGRQLGLASLAAQDEEEQHFWNDLARRWAPGI